jgi:hypothetical protein
MQTTAPADALSLKPNRGLRMPRRKSTRAQDRTQRIETEGPQPEKSARTLKTAAATRISLAPTTARGRRPPTVLSDGEQMPFAGHTLEFMSATVFELES